jgi:hypothetical protein
VTKWSVQNPARLDDWASLGARTPLITTFSPDESVVSPNRDMLELGVRLRIFKDRYQITEPVFIASAFAQDGMK